MARVAASPENEFPAPIPVLPLRDTVHFPGLINTLHVVRDGSRRAVRIALDEGTEVLCVSQRDMSVDDPRVADLYDLGVISEVMQAAPLPDGSMRVVLRATKRARMIKSSRKGGLLYAQLRTELGVSKSSVARGSTRTVALIRNAIEAFTKLVELNDAIPAESIATLAFLDEAGPVADTIAHHLPIKPAQKQVLLEKLDPMERLESTLEFVLREHEIWALRKELHDRVDGSLLSGQREFLLREQLRAIHIELGDDPMAAEVEALRHRAEECGLSDEAFAIFESELLKLERFGVGSPESAIIRGYLDVLLALPWATLSSLNGDLKQAERTLDQQHWGLVSAKERVLESLAVQARTPEAKSPILCFVGPPGVGKTSLASSIAAATGRVFSPISLGGLRDEAELRGHRRTYVGAMCGRILQAVKRAGTRNPLILLDEIDKLGRDFRFDPSAVLLEALDRTLNKNFVDHYLEFPFDLSQVMFIATANTVDGILPALLDRLEIVPFVGYSDQEKREIIYERLWPNALTEHGLSDVELSLTDDAIQALATRYSDEPGLRQIERHLNQICRKFVREQLDRTSLRLTAENLAEYIGEPAIQHKILPQGRVGTCWGLAVGEAGGACLEIEVVSLRSRSQDSSILITGNMGDVMRESAQLAISLSRRHAESLNLDIRFDRDLHIHIGQGGVPKDGPSAGLAVALALWSSVTEQALPGDIAAMGELSLNGHIRPVGGIRQKLMAASRAGIKKVLIPQGQRPDLAECPKEVLDSLEIIEVESFEDALQVVWGESA